LSLCSFSAQTFTVVTYNVENYFLTDFANRKAKTEASREKWLRSLPQLSLIF
jgi:hypothetical protein